jgi:hypothetical protein
MVLIITGYRRQMDHRLGGKGIDRQTSRRRLPGAGAFKRLRTWSRCRDLCGSKPPDLLSAEYTVVNVEIECLKFRGPNDETAELMPRLRI